MLGNGWPKMPANVTFGSSRIAGDAHERDNAMEVLKFSNIPKNGNDYELRHIRSPFFYYDF